MSVKKEDLVRWIGGLEALKDDVPEIMSQIAVGEGQYAVRQARLICTNDLSEPKRGKTGIVNTGNYRRNWKSDKTAKRSGNHYIVRFYNSLDYASHLEYGFRSHFVPGEHLSGPIRSKFPDGFYIGTPGSYVRGHFTMSRAKKKTLKSQQERVSRKFIREVNKRMK